MCIGAWPKRSAHLGDFANAKANYQKVMEYDPDSKHGKEAKRLLKDPQLANAPAVSANHASRANPAAVGSLAHADMTLSPASSQHLSS